MEKPLFINVYSGFYRIIVINSGNAGYYCVECCLEFRVVNHHWYGYVIDEEGDLHLEVSSELDSRSTSVTFQTMD